MTKLHPSLSAKQSGEPVKDVFDAQFLGEDEVFHFICKLGVIIEVQEDFDAAKDKVVEIF